MKKLLTILLLAIITLNINALKYKYKGDFKHLKAEDIQNILGISNIIVDTDDDELTLSSSDTITAETLALILNYSDSYYETFARKDDISGTQHNIQLSNLFYKFKNTSSTTTVKDSAITVFDFKTGILMAGLYKMDASWTWSSTTDKKIEFVFYIDGDTAFETILDDSTINEDVKNQNGGFIIKVLGYGQHHVQFKFWKREGNSSEILTVHGAAIIGSKLQ